MKITMYELLGMVKDGKAPKKVRYRYSYLYKDFKFDGETLNYISDKDFLFGEDITAMLNDEVEILEEEKKIPEQIKVKNFDKCIYDVTYKEKEFSLDIRELQIRYNELLDYLKSKGE